MKNTIKIAVIGSSKIIAGFDELPIDPEMTRIQTAGAIAGLDEAVAVDQKIEEKNRLIAKLKDQPPAVRLPQIESIDIEIKELTAAFDIKRREFIEANPVYAHPRKNEIALTSDQFQEIKGVFDGMENAQIVVDVETFESDVIIQDGKDNITAPFLRLNGYETIEDFRGKQWFYKAGDIWNASETVSDLGVTMSTVVPDEYEGEAIERGDLTAEQSEEIRVQGLTKDQKAEEKAQALDSAAAAALQMRGKLEIQGDEDALAKSQAWYADQVKLIEIKYGN